MTLSEDIVSVTDFARGTKEHLAALAKSNRPRILTQNGKAAAVVLSVKKFEELAWAEEERRLDLELKEALERYVKGERGRPLDEAFADLRRKLFGTKAGK
jgi:PHD/YefM family antitoxin component YafN of YafNO toxin-antitoxin module